MPSARPISLLLKPLAISSRTSTSRLLSCDWGPRSASVFETDCGITRAARVHFPDRGRDVDVRHGLEQVRLRAGIQRPPDVLVAVIRREHDEADVGIGLANLPDRLDPAQPGQAQVHQHDVGRPLHADRAGLLARAGLAGHRHVRLQADDRRQPEPDDRVIVDDEDANHDLLALVIRRPSSAGSSLGSADDLAETPDSCDVMGARR